jgi:hypothetical protein
MEDMVKNNVTDEVIVKEHLLTAIPQLFVEWLKKSADCCPEFATQDIMNSAGNG